VKRKEKSKSGKTKTSSTGGNLLSKQPNRDGGGWLVKKERGKKNATKKKKNIHEERLGGRKATSCENLGCLATRRKTTGGETKNTRRLGVLSDTQIREKTGRVSTPDKHKNITEEEVQFKGVLHKARGKKGGNYAGNA